MRRFTLLAVVLAGCSGGEGERPGEPLPATRNPTTATTTKEGKITSYTQVPELQQPSIPPVTTANLQAKHPGMEPYTPTRLEWLAMWATSQLDNTNGNVFFVASHQEPDTIRLTAKWNHKDDALSRVVRMGLKDHRDLILEKASQMQWEWVKVSTWEVDSKSTMAFDRSYPRKMEWLLLEMMANYAKSGPGYRINFYLDPDKLETMFIRVRYGPQANREDFNWHAQQAREFLEHKATLMGWKWLKVTEDVKQVD